MIGTYLVVNDEELEKIKSGELSLWDIKENACDIDKAWHVIQYMFTGELADGEPPYGYIVPMIAELLLPEVETDYGVFCLSEEQAAEAYTCIKGMTEAEFKEQFTFDEMAEAGVYPIVDDEDPEELFQYIWANFQALQDFYKMAAEGKQKVIFYIS